MTTSTPPKSSAPVPAPVPTTAFGVTIGATRQTAAAKPAMTSSQKRMVWMLSAIPVLGLIAWWVIHTPKDTDPEADQSPVVREVEHAAEKKDMAALAQFARSDDSTVARRAVSALVNVGGAEAVRDSLSDSREDVRYALVAALAETPEPPLEMIAPFMSDPATDVRVAAVRGVSHIRDFSIFDYLIPMLNDPNQSVRKAAFSAIEERIGLKFPEFNPNAPASEQAAAVNRMRAQISKMQQVFDQHNDFELQHQKTNHK